MKFPGRRYSCSHHVPSQSGFLNRESQLQSEATHPHILEYIPSALLQVNKALEWQAITAAYERVLLLPKAVCPEAWLPFYSLWPSFERRDKIVITNRTIVPQVPNTSWPIQRSDGRFGPQESSALSQFHEPGAWYKSFIPFPSPNLSHPATAPEPSWYYQRHSDENLNPVWYNINWRNMTLVQPGVWKVPQALLVSILRCQEKINKEWEDARTVRYQTHARHWDAFAPEDLKSRLALVTHFLVAEEGTTWDLIDAIADFQRCALHARGWVNYCFFLGNKFEDLHDVPPITELSQVTGTAPLQARGLFTRDLIEAAVCAHIGLPVWHVVDYSKRLERQLKQMAERNKISLARNITYGKTPNFHAVEITFTSNTHLAYSQLATALAQSTPLSPRIHHSETAARDPVPFTADGDEDVHAQEGVREQTDVHADKDVHSAVARISPSSPMHASKDGTTNSDGHAALEHAHPDPPRIDSSSLLPREAPPDNGVVITHTNNDSRPADVLPIASPAILMVAPPSDPVTAHASPLTDATSTVLGKRKEPPSSHACPDDKRTLPEPPDWDGLARNTKRNRPKVITELSRSIWRLPVEQRQQYVVPYEHNWQRIEDLLREDDLPPWFPSIYAPAWSAKSLVQHNLERLVIVSSTTDYPVPAHLSNCTLHLRLPPVSYFARMEPANLARAFRAWVSFLILSARLQHPSLRQTKASFRKSGGTSSSLPSSLRIPLRLWISWACASRSNPSSCLQRPLSLKI